MVARAEKLKIALLHLDLSGGPQEKNVQALCRGIAMAAAEGANWIITPEMALQGYFFTQMGRPYHVDEEVKKDIEPIIAAAKKHRVIVFLGCGERVPSDGRLYNSCIIIDADGVIIGRHHKMKIVGSATESWSSPGKTLQCVRCGDLSVGPLVCADAWYGENGECLGKLGADLLVVIAAWPPGCGGPPEEAWVRCSVRSGGLPVIVCNQTGTTNRMNCLIAKSAALQDGKLLFSYEGAPAVLLFDFDVAERQVASAAFIEMPYI